MPLPGYVSEPFDLFDRTTPDESHWYGPVNTLLGYLFPPQEYEVAPQYKGPVYPGSVKFTTLSSLPVTSASWQSGGAADRQMHQRFNHLVEGLIIPKLIGLSAIGLRFVVYEYDKASQALTPPEIASDLRIINDAAPAVRWAHNFWMLG
ncbi:hypothetical protein DFH08DRAFT_1085396 [Mycena albidolilacea]|uniref:Uncharacterized protein n=1 Tax=Mycena albidolilacea TaxID=1033008 RepID=A0AAD7EHH5_9AGAR|nr:hypothetical protein DFH08DRAFT_1085396 [Mycena albidolilacea]